MRRLNGRLVRLAPLLPLAAGILVAIQNADQGNARAETYLSAISLLHTGVIGNPYLLPSGPSALIAPLLTAFIAAVYKILGENTTEARMALGLLSACAYAVGAWLTIRICELNRVRPLGMAIAVSLTCVVPVYLYETVVYYRLWDQPWSAVIVLYALYVLLDAIRHDRPAWRPEIKLALLAGIGGLLSPAVLPPVVMGLLIMIRSRRAKQTQWRALALTASIVAVLLVPWGIRNEIQLGKFILTRSGFGLELATGNQDGANGFSTLGAPIHPFIDREAAERLAAVGEVRYMDEMTKLGMGWIAAHPMEAASLVARRVWYSFVPPVAAIAWMPVLAINGRWLVFAAFGLLKLAALARILVVGPMRLVWLSFCLLPLAPYFISHMDLRFEFIVFFPTVCMIATAIAGERVRKKGSEPAAPRLHADGLLGKNFPAVGRLAPVQRRVAAGWSALQDGVVGDRMARPALAAEAAGHGDGALRAGLAVGPRL